MITAIFLATLISLGAISSEADYENLTQEEQEYYQDIIIDDELGSF